NNETVTSIYIGHGTSPYTSANGIHIIDTGEVGVGVTNPQAQLEIKNPSGKPALMVGRVSGQPSIKSGADWLIMDSNTNPAALNYYTAQDVLLGYGGGSVGVGMTSPGQRLD